MESKRPWKPNGWYKVPSPSKNLDIDSTQCNLKECNMAEVPSITTKMTTVKVNHMANKQTVINTPAMPVAPKALPMVMVHKTVDNWAWANDKAHNLKYDAVCETQFKQNSMVWIT